MYVLALRISGLPRGLYHYASDRHLLERISTEVSREKATEYCAGQAWVEEAAGPSLPPRYFRDRCGSIVFRVPTEEL